MFVLAVCLVTAVIASWGFCVEPKYTLTYMLPQNDHCDCELGIWNGI